MRLKFFSPNATISTTDNIYLQRDTYGRSGNQKRTLQNIKGHRCSTSSANEVHLLVCDTSKRP